MTIPPSTGPRAPYRFRYDGQTMKALRRSASSERFSTYLRIAGGDRLYAFHLYTRNAALGASFHGPLQAVEVTLRNAAHDAMAAAHGPYWFDSPLLTAPEPGAVAKASRSLQRERKARTAGSVVSALNLGFWVALFKSKYDTTLWRTILYRCFDPTPQRSDLHRQLERLKTLRNRIAHHEPILQRNLVADHDAVLWVLSMLSPETAAWAEHHSRVLEEVERSPRKIARF